MFSSCDRTFWEVGYEGREFFVAFATTVSKYRSQFNASMFMSYWRKRFSTILQRCSAKVILRKLSKLSPNHGDLDRLFNFEIQGQVH